MNETSELGIENVNEFVQTFAKDISPEDLTLVPSHHFYNGFVFYYRDDCILKVHRSEYREAVLKEAKLIEYLNTQPLPCTIPKSLQFHHKGFYALYSRLNGTSLNVETLETFTTTELESFAKSLGTFLSFLHRHTFPDEILAIVPKTEEPYQAALKQAEQRLEFVEENAPETLFEEFHPNTPVDTARWKKKLISLGAFLNQRWALTHCDLQLSHLFCINSRPSQLGVIDFGDATQHDPAFDLAEFAIEIYSDLNPDGILAKKILDRVIAHYQTDDPALKEKIEFGLLEFEIGRAYQQVSRH